MDLHQKIPGNRIHSRSLSQNEPNSVGQAATLQNRIQEEIEKIQSILLSCQNGS